MFRKTLIKISAGLLFLTILLTFASFTKGSKNIKTNTQVNNFSEKIDSFIQRVIKETNYKAGFSISVVKGNDILFSKGYGYRNVEKKLPMTDETPIYIASATKPFLATAAKMLADEGILDLDAPISKYLPNLKFNPPLSTETICIRDLLTHRSGINNFPVVFRTAFSGEQKDSIVLKLFEYSLFKKHSFWYSNLGYVLTGIIMKKVTGKTWQKILEEKLFKPLNMNSTHAYVSVYNKSDLAEPYIVVNKQAERQQFIKDDNTMHAAGGMITTAKDAANWLKFHINNGKFNGKQIVSARSMDEMHSAQIDLSASFYDYNRFAYGLGWYLADYNVDLLIHHFGGYPGFRSHLSFMPKYKIGVAAFVNDAGEGFYLPDLIADYAYNLLSGGKNADQIMEKEYEKYKERVFKYRKKKMSSAKETKNNLSVNDIKTLSGTYYNKQFGTMKIFEQDNKLVAKMGNLDGWITKSGEGEFVVHLIVFSSDMDITVNKLNKKMTSFSLSSISWPAKKFMRVK